MDLKNGFGGFGGFGNFGGAGSNGSGGPNGFGSAKDMAEKFKQGNGKMTRGKKILLIVIVALVLLVLFAGRILNFVMDIWQVNEVGSGYTDIFWKNFFCRLAVSASGFLIVFIAATINLFVLRRLAFIKHTNVSFLEKKWPYFLFALVFSVVFGGIMGENAYVELLTALNYTDFHVEDPLFGRDIGYYVFIRPVF